MTPGVQLTQSFARWRCGTVRYAVTEETLALSETMRRFLENLTLGWDELSVGIKIGQAQHYKFYFVNMRWDVSFVFRLVFVVQLGLPGNFPVMTTESSNSQTLPWL